MERGASEEIKMMSTLTLDDFRVCIDGKSSGAVRISVGLVSNFADVYRLLQFTRGFLDASAEED
jgi:selenocysteine lyase/cysteine desulfurase